jgi:hypothetical protein
LLEAVTSRDTETEEKYWEELLAEGKNYKYSRRSARKPGLSHVENMLMHSLGLAGLH